MSRIVITDCDQGSIEIERTVFSTAGHEVTLAQCRTADEVIAVGSRRRSRSWPSTRPSRQRSWMRCRRSGSSVDMA